MTVKQSIDALLEGESMVAPTCVYNKPTTLSDGKHSFNLVFGITPEGRPSLSAKDSNGDRVSVSIKVTPGFSGSILSLSAQQASFLREKGAGSGTLVREFTDKNTGEIVRYRTFIIDTTQPELPEEDVREMWPS